MILNSEFDTSLILMIESDPQNGEKLIQFLQEIPDELYQKIKNAINKQNFQGRILDNISVGNSIYHFHFDEQGNLMLRKESFVNHHLITDIEVNLKNGINADDIGLKNMIGNVQYEFYNSTKDKDVYAETDYEVIKMPFGYIIHSLLILNLLTIKIFPLI